MTLFQGVIFCWENFMFKGNGRRVENIQNIIIGNVLYRDSYDNGNRGEFT
ncbi:hypothetical protein SAMN04488577_0973 [Bacillus sp. cl95]|nr:hypothetical protein SAMN02799634_101698 [Bacillus sp. UNCCL13]SFQ67701.1 hypothetical protein SAMN04488577_0973 [Bacillus sp. cl95]